MNLPQETLDRIDKEAKQYAAAMKPSDYLMNDFEIQQIRRWAKKDYSSGAYCEATRNLADKEEIEKLKKELEIAKLIPVTCPKCGGQGIVSKPPWIAGDVHKWDGITSTSFQCNVCNGNKILWR